jgi:hypothetical protein
MSDASGDRLGNSFARTSHANAIKARSSTSGSGPAPIQTPAIPGHNSGNARKSGTSTSANSLFCIGRRPGGAIVKRVCSVKG